MESYFLTTLSDAKYIVYIIYYRYISEYHEKINIESGSSLISFNLLMRSKLFFIKLGAMESLMIL